MIPFALCSWMLVAPALHSAVDAPPGSVVTVAHAAAHAVPRDDEAPARSTASRVAEAALGWRALPAAIPGGLFLGGLANVVVVLPLAVAVTSAIVIVEDKGKTSNLSDPKFTSIFYPALGLGWLTLVAATGVLGLLTFAGSGLSGALLGAVALRD